MKRRPIKDFIWVIVELIILIGADSLIRYENSFSKAEEKINASLNEILEKHKSIINDTADLNEFLNKIEVRDYDEKRQRGQAVYLVDDGKLRFWNTNIFDIQALPHPFKDSIYITKQSNETFLVTQFQKDSLNLVVATLLYRNNPYDINDNNFIPSHINGIYSIDFEFDTNDNLIFTLDYQAKINDLPALVLFFLLLIIEFTIYKGIYKIIQRSIYTRNKYWFFLISSILIFVVLKWIKTPLFLSASSLFSNFCIMPDTLIAFSLIRFAEFVLFLMSNVFVLSKTILQKELKINNITRIFISTTLFLVFYLALLFFLYQLIEKANIPFSFLQIYNTTIYSYIFLFLISIMTSSIIILISGMMKQYINSQTNGILTIFVFIIMAMIIELIICHFLDFVYTMITNTIGFIFFITLFIENKFYKDSKKITGNIIIVVLMAILLTIILYRINESNEKEEMNWFAWIIGNESDKAFENAVVPILSDIKEDDTIRKWQTENYIPSDDSIKKYLDKYYFDKSPVIEYNKSTILCNENTILLLNDTLEISCFDLSQSLAKINHIKLIDNNLVLIDDPSTDSYYLAAINFFSSDSLTKHVLYIEFYKEYILNAIGIPEMLTSYQDIIMPKLHNYSFSCYQDSILSYKYGRYNYPNDLHKYRFWNRNYVKTKNFKHLIVNPEDYKTIIVTIETQQWMEIIAPFSYFFIALLLMHYFNMRIENGKRKKVRNRSLHSKMQFTFLMTLGFSFLIVGLTSFLFLRNNLNDSISNGHFERSKAILKGMEETINKKSDIKDPKLLDSYKETFFTDINIYNIDGELINTTQPILYDGICTKYINKSGYDAIVKDKRLYFSHHEYIEGIKFQSSYIPITERNGNLIAILNIPNFNNNLEDRDSMSDFIITYINLMFVLMGLSGIIVILITRNTIKPLSMIQEKMRQIKLGESNKEIDWESDDEIGELIKQYNNLIHELDESAKKLARSERETAWREMARQVAHEIKNPLTAMKLSLQYLQMSWNEHDENIDIKFKDTTNSILEQIDSLNDIATSFSNYAKLPQNNPETFNLNELILNIINIYHTESNITINYKSDNNENLIFADKNNLGRVFGNIIKNSIQAIGNKKDGLINVNISRIEEKYLVSIEDNGCGIKEEEKKKIFLPNFTTKSSGMGVGLSIVYDILETMGGKIWFESEEGKGSTFWVMIGGERSEKREERIFIIK